MVCTEHLAHRFTIIHGGFNMSESIFQKLEAKVDCALEAMELLRMQIEEQEEKNKALQADNAALKHKQSEWEHHLTALLRKLEGADLNPGKLETSDIEIFEAA